MQQVSMKQTGDGEQKLGRESYQHCGSVFADQLHCSKRHRWSDFIMSSIRRQPTAFKIASLAHNER